MKVHRAKRPSPRTRADSRLSRGDSAMLQMVARTLANSVLVNEAAQSVAREACIQKPVDPALASLFTSPAATLAMIHSALRSQHIELEFAANQTKRLLDRAAMSVQS